MQPDPATCDKHIVLIEDESDLAELLRLHLADIGAHVTHFTDGARGWEFVSRKPFDVLVLDINLPGMNGFEICRNLRQSGRMEPILMLTARSEEMDKVLGLETGADDYLTKPFSVREFQARIKALCRRSSMTKTEGQDLRDIRYRNMHIDLDKRSVNIGQQRIELTPKEYDLLLLLASNPGTTFERKELLNKVWGYDFVGYEHTVNSHINRLRSKIEKDANNPEYVLTTWGVGYRFNDQ